MRLLQLSPTDELSLTPDFVNDVPPYAILSHTWGHNSEEVSFQDVMENRGKDKNGYQKILFCGQQARRDGLVYFWVDTCCIDKTSSAELTEAINSMFRWYRNAVHCYVYLPDVSNGPGHAGQGARQWDAQFRQSRWFTRGWTLQELLAPTSVKFFCTGGTFLGDRTSLQNLIHVITNIKIPALRGDPLDQFPVLERMYWSSNRQTTKDEDAAYCLLGIFGVHLSPIYGEGKVNAMNRLLKSIEQHTGIPYVLPFDSSSNLTSNSYHTTSNLAQEAHLLVPFGQNDEFVGRQNILVDLVQKVLPSAKKNDCQRVVLEGLGGVGKTQIALETAYRVHQDSSCSVFWVPAITMVTFENAYREIGEALGTPGIDDEKSDIMALVKTALEKSAVSWLLIIDNVDDISLLDSGGLQDYLPFNRKGSILFTTRNHEVAVRLDVSEKDTYIIDEMSEDEALKLLQRSGLKERQYQDLQAAKELVQHLVCLPLAIKQASAYMARTRITAARYLQLCLTSSETQISLLNADFEERRRYSKNTNPITMTWLISFQHIAQSYPLAVSYLKFICFLAEKDIPMSILPHKDDEQARDEAVGILEGYAFISVREQVRSFDIHRLVRLATRNWIKAEWEVCCTKAIQQLAKEYPFPRHENRQTWTRYMPHVEMALQVYEHCTDKEATSHFLFNVAQSYNDLAKYAEAEEMHREVLELRKLLLSTDHPSISSSINNLAQVLMKRGKYEEAETMFRQTLQLCQESRGLEHPSTLRRISNLALVLKKRGKYKETEEMHRNVLELRKSVLGPDHPSTLSSMNNLALVLDDRGKYKESEEMHREALELKKSVLSPDHPSISSSINNLAEVIRCQGRFEEAETMFRQTLQLCQEIRGLEHPSTLRRINNLALVLKKQGKYKEAEEMHRKVLELRKSVLGPDHPSTLSSMNNLALVLKKQGKYEEAEGMHRDVLELEKSVLSPDHPSTLSSMNNLALVLKKRGKYNEAAEMHQETLKLKESVLGLDHPSTTKSRDNLQQLQDFLDARLENWSEVTSDDSENEGGVTL